MKNIRKKLRDSAEDVCIIAGMACVAAAAFCVCLPLGLLTAGIELTLVGVWFTVHPIGGDKN